MPAFCRALQAVQVSLYLGEFIPNTIPAPSLSNCALSSGTNNLHNIYFLIDVVLSSVHVPKCPIKPNRSCVKVVLLTNYDLRPNIV